MRERADGVEGRYVVIESRHVHERDSALRSFLLFGKHFPSSHEHRFFSDDLFLSYFPLFNRFIVGYERWSDSGVRGEGYRATFP